ncbi:MAG: PKD domain-containing protein [Saprospiraceae bacterium]|nr:PKD domain-containing protein [Saprospiraceae bacterium]
MAHSVSKHVFLILFAWLLVLPAGLQGMHIIGGEITYVCEGEISPGVNRYRFTMKVYRDCFGGGADFDKPAYLAIYRGSYTVNSLFAEFCVAGTSSMCNQGQYTQFQVIPDTPDCVARVPRVCVEQAEYVFTRDLPISQTQSYYVVYQRCCRNVTINNIIDPGDIGATYFVELTPAAQQACNNSPTFNEFPPVFVCNNFPLKFDHSATDVDGDQLVYSFCSPLTGGGPLLSPQAVLFSCDGAAPRPPCGPPFDNVPFAVPAFTPGNPMGGNPVVSINSVNGLISGTPNILGQFVVGVCVQEFRNGVLLSTIRRDFQFNVTDCSPSVVAGISTDSFQLVGAQRYRVKACGDRTVTFLNQSGQMQFIDDFRWEFTFNNGDVYVDSVNWNATVTFPDTGFYRGVLVLNPGKVCNDTAFIEVDVFPPVNADFSFTYDTCIAGPVNFTDLSSGIAGIRDWAWDFGVPGGVSVEQNPAYRYAIPGNHPVRLRVTDNNICSDVSTQTINWFPVPPLIILKPSSFIGCIPTEIFFDNLSTPIDSTYQIIWDFGDGTVQNGPISPTHTYTVPGVYTVRVEITSPIGCFTSDDFSNLIRAEPSPTAGFTYVPDTLLSNFNRTLQFIDKSLDANRWFWDFGGYDTSVEQNPSFTFPDTGAVCVTQIVTHPQGCKDSLTRCFDIRPEVRWHMPNAFTPNGDGTNDTFFGKGFMEGATGFVMTIWNRWGELVFETNNPDEGWNGRYMNTGGMSPQGVYVYLVTFKGPRQEPFEFKGFVTLLN